MKNRSDINRMASMMGKVKNGLHMMGDGSGKEKRATKKAMKEEAKSAPDKMPTLKTQKLPEGGKMSRKKTMHGKVKNYGEIDKLFSDYSRLNTFGLRDEDIFGWPGTVNGSEPIMKSRKTENPRKYIRDFAPGLNERNDRDKAKRFENTLDEATKSGEHWRMKEFMRGDQNFEKYLKRPKGY